MKYISDFKLFEFNRKDKQLLLSPGINDMFTVAFEFELESNDENLTLLDSDDQIILSIILNLKKELDLDGVKYTQEFFDQLKELTDFSNMDKTLKQLTKLSKLKKIGEDQKYAAVRYIEELEKTEIEDTAAVERKKAQEKKKMVKYGESKVKEHLPKFYKKYKKDLKFEFDQSLERGIEFSPKTYVVSINKALEMINDFYNEFDKQDYWLMNMNTSIHINIGFTNPVKWNIIKGLIMINELRKDEVPFAFKGIEDRIDTSFTQGLLDYLKIYRVNALEKLGVLDFPSIEFVEKHLLNQLDVVVAKFCMKTFALNINHIKDHNYAEYRHVGGQVDKELVIDKIMYFAYVTYMMTTNYKDKEYHKKLYKFIDNLKVPNKVYQRKDEE